MHVVSVFKHFPAFTIQQVFQTICHTSGY